MAPPYPLFPLGKFGSRPNIHPNQRLGLEQLEALRDAIFADREAADGADLGACEGVLTAGGYAFQDLGETLKVIHFNTQMVLAGFKNAGNANDRATGGTLHYVPTDPDQGQTNVNVHGYQGSTGALWWRPGLIPTLIGVWAEIKAGWPQGKWRPDPLVLKCRAYFTVTANFATPPTDGEVWYRLARLDWTDAEADPVVTFLHAYDIGRHLSPTVNPLSFIGGLMTHPDYHDAASNNGRSYSTARAISIIGHLLMKLMNGSTYSWNPMTGQVTTPGELTLAADLSRGVPQLGDALTEAEDDIEALQATVADLQSQITALQNRNRLVYWASINADGTIAREGGDLIDGGGSVEVTHTPSSGVYSLVMSAAVRNDNEEAHADASALLEQRTAFAVMASSVAVSAYTFSGGTPTDAPFSVRVRGRFVT